MTKKQVVTIVSIIAVGALLIKGRTLLKARQEAIAQTPPPQTRSVEVSLVDPTPGRLRPFRMFNAQLDAGRSVTLSTRVSGYVADINATEAQQVSKGEVLVRIDDSDLRRDIATLEKTRDVQKEEVAYAQRVYRSNIDVYKAGGLSKEKLDASRLTYLLKQAQLQTTLDKLAKAKHQLVYTRIEAPFDGVIESVRVHRGDLAAPGRPLIVMRDATQKLRFSFPPEQIDAVKPGFDVYDATGYIGKIASVYPSAKNGLSIAEVVLEKSLALPTGSYLPVSVYGEEKEGCMVPSDTLLYRKNGSFVVLYDVSSHRFTMRRVDVAVSTPQKALIARCFDMPLARGSEAVLSRLESYGNVTVRGVNDGAK